MALNWPWLHGLVWEGALILGGFLLCVGVFHIIGGTSTRFEVESQGNITAQQWLSTLAFLNQAYLKFQTNNPYNESINYTCLPRARDFVEIATKLGYDAYVEYGCNGTIGEDNTSCHAWAVVRNEFLGARKAYPILPDDKLRQAWDNYPTPYD